NATPPTIGIPECWQGMHGLAFGIDRLAPAHRVLAPMGNETPAQRVERHLASLVIAPDYQQVLARRAVPSGRIIVHAGVTHGQGMGDGITEVSRGFDNSPAHDGYVVIPRGEFSAGANCHSTGVLVHAALILSDRTLKPGSWICLLQSFTLTGKSTHAAA